MVPPELAAVAGEELVGVAAAAVAAGVEDEESLAGRSFDGDFAAVDLQ